MRAVCLDTGFLISFSDPTKPWHSYAVKCFKQCVANKIPIYVSTIVASEFAVGQPFEDLPLANFRILNFNLAHAKTAAEFRNIVQDVRTKGTPNERMIIQNDVKIIAQAHQEGIPFILTRDVKTLEKMVTRLSNCGATPLRAITLHKGVDILGEFEGGQGSLF